MSARIVLLSVGVLLVFAAFGTYLSGRTPDIGSIGAIEDGLGTTTTVIPSTTFTTTPPSEPVEPRPSLEPNPVTRLDEITLSDRMPTRLMIPSLGVDAPVEGYGVNRRTGQMDVPRNVQDVAWYRYGPAPGEPGSAVLAAHVDLSDQGRGVFFGLRRLELGDVVTVAFAEGGSRDFQVVARVTYDKEDLPLDRIFSSEGSPVLTLVTCGGSFSGGRYQSNVVVYAVPLAPPDADGPS